LIVDCYDDGRVEHRRVADRRRCAAGRAMRRRVARAQLDAGRLARRSHEVREIERERERERERAVDNIHIVSFLTLLLSESNNTAIFHRHSPSFVWRWSCCAVAVNSVIVLSKRTATCCAISSQRCFVCCRCCVLAR
jgi:hypothetical protein